MMSAKEVKAWVNTIDDNKNIAIDDGGLTLIELDDAGQVDSAYLEIGGVPTSDE